MEGRIFLNTGRIERIAILEGKYCLMLGSVILVDPPNVFPQRNTPDKQKEQDEPYAPINQIKNNPSAQGGINPLQFRCCQKRHVLVHEDEECKGDDDVYSRQPGADGGGFLPRVGSGFGCL